VLTLSVTVAKTWLYFHCDLKTGAAEKPAPGKYGDAVACRRSGRHTGRSGEAYSDSLAASATRLGARRGNRGRGRAWPAVWAGPPARQRTNPAGRPGRRPRSSFPPIQRPRAAAGHASESESILSRYGPVAHPRRSLPPGRTARLCQWAAAAYAGASRGRRRRLRPARWRPIGRAKQRPPPTGHTGWRCRAARLFVGQLGLEVRKLESWSRLQTPESRLGLLRHTCEWMFTGQGHDSCISFKVIYMQFNH
jgi:hypothetical protein